MRPFDKQFVLLTTYENIEKALDKSTKITAGRLSDRKDKGLEILETLDILNRWRQLNEDFRSNNPQLFGDDTQ